MKKIAIIGASRGQRHLCEKARQMGLYTIGFAWDDGAAVCKELFSKFYPISIMEKDKIIEICKKENVDGVVSTGSEITTEIACYVANKLGLNGNNYENLIKFRDKYKVRQVTNSIPGLTPIKTLLINNVDDIPVYPCIIKPCRSSGKFGVSYVESKEKAIEALNYAKEIGSAIVEEYVEGQEISVECISYKGQHKVVTIIDKQNLGVPHFVDTRLTIPTTLSEDNKKRIYEISPKILDAVCFENGPAHIDMKVCGDKIYLIEVNLRGIGGGSPGFLFEYALDFDYTKAIIDVALEVFEFPYKINNVKNISSFLYYKQNEEEYKEIMRNKKIIVHKLYKEKPVLATTLADICGFIVYENE